MAAVDVPFYSDAKRAYGALSRVMALPCNIPLEIYVEAAIAGAWKAVTSILEPDPKEVYHQLIGNSLYHDIKGGLESSGIVAPAEDSKLTRFLFKTADVVDVSAWYLFLFSSVTEGLIDFSSQIMKMRPCETPHSQFYKHGGGYLGAIGDDGAWYGPDFGFVTGQGVFSPGPALAQARRGQTMFIATQQSWQDAGGVPVASAARIINTDSGAVLDYHSADPNTAPYTQQALTWYRMKNGTNAILQMQAQASYTGGAHLPLGECFEIPSGFSGSVYTPGSL